MLPELKIDTQDLGNGLSLTERRILLNGDGAAYNLAQMSEQMRADKAAFIASLGGDPGPVLARQDLVQVRNDATGFTAAIDKDLVAKLNEMLETYYAPLDALLFVDQKPLARSDVWAEEYEWTKRDHVGEAIVGMTLDDTEVPSTNAQVERFRSKFINFKAGYHWNLEDMQGRGLTSIDIIAERQKAARDLIARAQDNYILFGNDAANIKGLFNSTAPNVLSTSASALPTDLSADYIDGGWKALATGSDANRVTLLEDIGKMVNQQEELANTGNGPDNQQLLADTLILPRDVLRAFEQTPFSTQYKDRSVMEEIKLRFPQIRNYWFSTKLATAGAGNGPRAVFYKKSVDVVHLVAPIMYEEIPAQFRAFATKIHAFGRFGQVDFKQPVAAMYVDGI